MRIAYAIPVRQVETLQDGSLLVLGLGADVFQVEIPSRVNVPLVISLAASQHEAQAGIQHELKVSILGPDLTEVTPPMMVPFQMAPGPNTPPGWEVRSIFPIVAVFEVNEPGVYSLEISTDNNPPTSVTIIVNEAGAPTP